MTDAVPLDELLHEEALFGFTGVRKVGVPEDTYSRLDFASPPSYISSSLGMVRPFTNKVEKKGWKKCTDPTVDGARSITLYDACTPSSGGEVGP